MEDEYSRGSRTEEASITKELEDITLNAATVVGGRGIRS